MAAVSLPFLALIALELVLRWADIGYNPRYFLRTTIQGERVWTENRDFTKRFFPPGLARTPLPIALPVDKDPDATRIFIFGESAAMGDPEPAYGFGRFLEVLLRDRFPGRKFEIANLATTAISSHVVREIARETVSRDGDIWIVYMGNNEVVGPYGAGTVFGDRVPNLFEIRTGLAIKATRIGQLAENIRQQWLASGETPRQWEGMEMFLDRQVRQTDPALNRVYGHFESNLREIVRLGVDSGARVLVSTVAVNLKDCPPFASLPGAAWSAEQARQWTNALNRGTALMDSNDFQGAIREFDSALAIDDRFAEAHFRKAVCDLELEDLDNALAGFGRARDLDTLRFRADGRINDIIRGLTVGYDSNRVALLDAASVVNDRSGDGVAGQELFFEHVHFNPAGNLLLARAMADRLAPWLNGNLSAADGGLSDEICEQRLALTDWDRRRVLEEMLQRLRQPPFNGQWRHEERLRRWEDIENRLDEKLNAEELARAAMIYQQAVARAPRDFVLRARHAAFLETTGQWEAAAASWRAVVAMRPMSHDACFHLANTLDKLGRSEEAVMWFQKALVIEPGLPEVRNGLALALANLQRNAEARKLLAQLVEKQPDFVEARINLGQLLSQSGRDDLAARQYTEVLERQPDNAAAHINLGRVLGRRGEWNEAVVHFREALRIDENSAAAWFNLARALTSQKSPEALDAYAKAVSLDPEMTAARYNYGLALAEAGRTAEAFGQFEELVRRQPGMPEARFNYAVALAKMQRFEEAAREFGETLRLDPAHAQARQFLQQARAMAEER